LKIYRLATSVSAPISSRTVVLENDFILAKEALPHALVFSPTFWAVKSQCVLLFTVRHRWHRKLYKYEIAKTWLRVKTWGRCYDHNFRRFLPIFGEKNWRFSQKPML
jgi:hypothetical protein